MQFLKLSPLQTRFAASLAATVALVLIYLSLTQPHLAYAVELDSTVSPDSQILYEYAFDDLEDTIEEGPPQWDEVDRRQTSSYLYLKNNEAQNKDITSGESQNWVFQKSEIDGPAGERGKGLPSDSKDVSARTVEKLELRKRQSAKPVYVSINTCMQPVSTTDSDDLASIVPPPLVLYFSQSASNPNPGPSSTGDQQNMTVDNGYALVNITTDSDLYVGIAATNTTGFSGGWNYEIAASIDAPYHSVESNTPYLHFIDSDNHAALLVTDNFTQALPNSTVYQEWMSLPPPYGMMGHDHDDPSILGVSKSYCGLMHNAKIMVNLENVRNQNFAGMTTRGLGAKPKEEIYITFLNASSSYWGFLAMEGNSTNSGLNVVGGGGKVWMPVNFTTKTETNCALMYNLSFCSEVAYAVPSNPDLFSPRGGVPELAKLYDDNAQNLYQYFNYSLQQIPCNTTASAQYSLARGCDDCARAYKTWLCAVTIPRCQDFTDTASYLKARNLAQPFPNGTTLNFPPDSPSLTTVSSNQSRNALIDTEIRPGPYKEVLPCQDLCYDLVQSCPAALGFGCPLPGSGLEDSYGFRSSNGGEITCSYLGAAYYLSAGMRIKSGVASKVIVLFVIGLSFVMSV